ncbi:hypothetical protein O3W44_15180 [Pantoea sp. LMR881]|uniref:hypothetical protein n=1 Tax=Pantoea sp. LMR881 TaxID=3014336 RepID=UPI0022B032B3|nr:hypothetical protein [Pantoea sp. LMR881]MCZ4060157.1 hypothetical protein [Pantoea sp. LMR881]
MTRLFQRSVKHVLAVPGKFMQQMVQKNIQQSDSSKITTDANGAATLNMSNKQVRESMRARMEELASKG